MNTRLIFIGITAFLLLGCNDEDVNPKRTIIGTWQSVFHLSEYDYVSTFEIIPDGTIKGSETLRQKGSPVDLGYASEFAGIYRVEGTKLIVIRNQFSLPTDTKLQYADKELLVSVEDGETIMEYAIESDFSKFYYICPPNASCAPPEPFIKID
ncbi:hypothetical protein U3A58_15165 [Algoriphagus sp. C2-6-M1]|uniref:hypothetical protein n=1 Tax=Algoriphagus persicinus TaxID=3108754 RepID=UPI002B367875|nr:hypothetical protein [Algoriphagus sp. C2-6-M1]MEB2781737.1 hypothetical protein [Algoriphagus sp. C2-6-M1]